MTRLVCHDEKRWIGPYQTILIIRDIRVIGGFCHSRGHKFSL